MNNFCKACGSLLKQGVCLYGHSAALTDRIKKVINAEDGARVLISKDNASLGKEFWAYACEHKTKIYMLKIKYRKPASFLRIRSNFNPCEKGQKDCIEAYDLQGLINYETEENRLLRQANANLENWVYNKTKHYP